MLLRRFFYSLAALAAVLTSMPDARAASIALTPNGASALSGGGVAFAMTANFEGSVTTGGALDVSWDPLVLQFQSFSFSSLLASPVRDAAFDVIDLQGPGLLSVGFGSFSGIALPTTTVIGTLSFLAIGTPGSSSQLALADSIKWAGFFGTDGDPIEVAYTGAAVSVVPLPAAVWLFASGLAGLVGSRRRGPARPSA